MGITGNNSNNRINRGQANNTFTKFQYDKNNRLLKEIRPMGEEIAFNYDGNGNLIQRIDAKNNKTVYTYDDASRLVEVNYYNASDDLNPVKTLTYSYDKTGRLKSYDDGVTSASYEFDDTGKKLSETVNYGPFSKTHAYTYYKNGTKETFTGPDGIAYGYLYNRNNQLTGVQIPGNGFISWNKYKWVMPESVTLPGGSTKDYTYDPLMRLKSIAVKDPAKTALMGYHYDYDKESNITEKKTETGDFVYGYDDLYRLISADNPDMNDEAFTYDNVGNRLTKEGDVGVWDYNDNNELETRDDVSYTYDDNGNLIQKLANGVTSVYKYNIENRLERVEDGSGSLIASYYYDPFGRRLWKEVGGVRTYYHYADEGLVAEFDHSGDVIKTYGYKPGSVWTTDPLFMKVGDVYYYYQNDHLGTPQKLIKGSGQVVWSAKYDSFGKAEVDSGSLVENNLRFPGQYFDTEIGLHYNWNRYYDQDLGRYLRVDPIGLSGGLNLYGYVGVNPLNWGDPEGLEPYWKKAWDRFQKYRNEWNSRYYHEPNPPPKPGDYYDYCDEEYRKKKKECFKSTDCTCLDKARQWYTQCTAKANDANGY